MQSAYIDLHRAGFANSIEVWSEDNLAGGLYGIAIGRVFGILSSVMWSADGLTYPSFQERLSVLSSERLGWPDDCDRIPAIDSLMSEEQQRLSFYTTSAHNCSYLTDQKATTLFLDPAVTVGHGLSGLLADNGFRRSGNHYFRTVLYPIA
jgi:hypothetical protein